MRRVWFPSLVCAALIAVPAGSAAQGLPSDPEADSPSGVIYEIPVDRARNDAAPRRGTQRTGDVDGSSETSIRSENNFGTSSDVPAADGGASSDENGASRGGSSSKDRDGTSSKDRDGTNAVERVAGSTTPRASAPSETNVYLLLAALVAVGAGIGLLAAHRSSRGRRS